MGLGGAVLDLLLPQTCAACGVPTPEGLCATCAEELPELSLGERGRVVLADGVLAVGAYAYAGVVREALLSIKVAGRHAAAAPLSRLLWFELDLPAPPDAPWPVTWVPSTRRVRRHRGVEVPQRLAGPGAVPLLRRVRRGADQTDLDAAARRRGPVGAFQATGAVPPKVVLVDDVRTTGATARAAALALRAGGAMQVLVATFAVAAEP